jgi:hypothetical protein
VTLPLVVSTVQVLTMFRTRSTVLVESYMYHVIGVQYSESTVGCCESHDETVRYEIIQYGIVRRDSLQSKNL